MLICEKYKKKSINRQVFSRNESLGLKNVERKNSNCRQLNEKKVKQKNASKENSLTVQRSVK